MWRINVMVFVGERRTRWWVFFGEKMIPLLCDILPYFFSEFCLDVIVEVPLLILPEKSGATSKCFHHLPERAWDSNAPNQRIPRPVTTEVAGLTFEQVKYYHHTLVVGSFEVS